MRMESPLNQRLRWSPPDVVYTPIDVTSRFTSSQGSSIRHRALPDGLTLQRLDDAEDIALWIEKLTHFDALTRHLLSLSYYRAAQGCGLLKECCCIVNLRVQPHAGRSLGHLSSAT